MGQENQNQPAGVLLVVKPRGITSHDVVDRVRRIFRMKKVGHAGTLDPMATGLAIGLLYPDKMGSAVSATGSLPRLNTRQKILRTPASFQYR